MRCLAFLTRAGMAAMIAAMCLSFGATTSVSAADANSLKSTQVAQKGSQTAQLPVGKIRLRVINGIGGSTLREDIRWEVKTYGRDSSGKRQSVARTSGSNPELELPQGWYLVYAHMNDGTIRHPIEVTGGRTFKYTLVKD
jgi:hypothetical protein